MRVKEAPKKFHFLGICGTAMASVAAALQERGFKVTGSDENVYPPMSTFLREKGIALKEGYRAGNIPPDADVVVIGNAMKRGNPEVEAVLNRKLFYLSLPEVLKNYFLRGKHNLVVTGTHGKTTTTSLLTWIMEKAGRKPGYLIGGIPKNLGQGARLNGCKYFVIEGDEYDSAFFDKRSKFIHYLPKLLIVNNIEFDHADIFPNLDAIKLNFRQLINIVPQNGMLLLNGDDPNCVECRRDLAPAGASAAKKRYRGSFQQWGFDWDSREAARTARSIGGSIMKIAICCLVLATISVSGLQAGTAPGLDAVQVASGLTRPLFVTAPPGDFTRLFIVQQDGNIRILNLLTRTLNPAPFLTLTGLTDTRGEQGLLGMAFDPNYATNGKFYLNFTVPGGAFVNGVTHVSQFSVSGNPDIADPNSERILITFDHP